MEKLARLEGYAPDILEHWGFKPVLQGTRDNLAHLMPKTLHTL